MVLFRCLAALTACHRLCPRLSHTEGTRAIHRLRDSGRSDDGLLVKRPVVDGCSTALGASIRQSRTLPDGSRVDALDSGGYGTRRYAGNIAACRCHHRGRFADLRHHLLYRLLACADTRFRVDTRGSLWPGLDAGKPLPALQPPGLGHAGVATGADLPHHRCLLPGADTRRYCRRSCLADPADTRSGCHAPVTLSTWLASLPACWLGDRHAAGA